MTQREENTSITMRWGLSVLFIVPVLIVIVTAQFSRMIADDFNYAMIAEEEGVWGAVSYWYDAWTGNYSSSFLQSAVTQIDVTALGILLSVTIVLWWFGSWWLAYEIAKRMKWARPVSTSLLIASMLFVVVIDGLPNIYDTLYWAAGAIAHVVPLVGVIYFVAFVLFFARQNPSHITVVLISGLTGVYFLIVGGFSTPSNAHLIVLLIVLIILFWRFGSVAEREAVLPVLLIALLTVAVTMFIISQAPGTDIRQSRFPPTPELTEFVQLTVTYMLAFVVTELAILSPMSLLFTLSVMGWVGYRFHSGNTAMLLRKRWHIMGALWLTAFLLIGAGFSTGAYATSAYLPARANTTPVYTLVITVAVWGYVMGAVLRKKAQAKVSKMPRLLFGTIILLGILGPGWVLFSSVQQLSNMHAFNQDWHRIDRELRSAVEDGERDVIVSGFRFDLGDKAVDAPMDDNPATFTNRDLAGYYGLDSVSIP